MKVGVTPNPSPNPNQVDLGRWLRTSTWTPVRIRHDERGLSVWHGGRRWVSDYQIRGWDPQPSWRLGVGARSGRWPERHWIDWLEIESEMLVAEAETTLELSTNGQQFSSFATQLGGGGFAFHAMPIVSSATPARLGLGLG